MAGVTCVALCLVVRARLRVALVGGHTNRFTYAHWLAIGEVVTVEAG